MLFSLAIQTDAVVAPITSVSTSGMATGSGVPVVQKTASVPEPPRTRSKSIKTELLSPPASEFLQPAPVPVVRFRLSADHCVIIETTNSSSS